VRRYQDLHHRQLANLVPRINAGSRVVPKSDTRVARLASMKTWTETIQSNSGKILDEVRNMADNLEKQVAVLRESVEILRQE